MKILIACEESQVVMKAFRRKGHEAYSCDILPCSGGYPEYHIQKDVTDILKQHWDMIIAHPPCTYLSVSGLHWNKKRPERAKETEKALDFVKLFFNHPCKKKAIENPISCISSRIRKPDQIIQPYQFGHDASKSTCLWLTGLKPLIPTKLIEGRLVCCRKILDNGLDKYGCPICNGENVARRRWGNQTNSGQNKLPPSKDRAKLRSKTYRGIAEAMANQWG